MCNTDEQIKYIQNELQGIAMDHMRVSNRIHSLKIYLQRLDIPEDVQDLLEFDDPILRDVPHG
jgi:hypothetical protein